MYVAAKWLFGFLNSKISALDGPTYGGGEKITAQKLDRCAGHGARGAWRTWRRTCRAPRRTGAQGSYLVHRHVDPPGRVVDVGRNRQHHAARRGKGGKNASYYNDDDKRTKGMYMQRIQKAWGHTVHRDWARLLLNRARDLITHGPAHRGANGATIPTDEDDQDGRFFFNHPGRGGFSAA